MNVFKPRRSSSSRTKNRIVGVPSRSPNPDSLTVKGNFGRSLHAPPHLQLSKAFVVFIKLLFHSENEHLGLMGDRQLGPALAAVESPV
jgi:hypothetical protein